MGIFSLSRTNPNQMAMMSEKAKKHENFAFESNRSNRFYPPYLGIFESVTRNCISALRIRIWQSCEAWMSAIFGLTSKVLEIPGESAISASRELVDTNFASKLNRVLADMMLETIQLTTNMRSIASNLVYSHKGMADPVKHVCQDFFRPIDNGW